MKWFLQFLSIGSVVLYALLVIMDNRIPDSPVENALVSEAHPKQRRLSVWDSHLPYRSFGQDRQASLVLGLCVERMRPSHQNPIGRAPVNISTTGLHPTPN